MNFMEGLRDHKTRCWFAFFHLIPPLLSLSPEKAEKGGAIKEKSHAESYIRILIPSHLWTNNKDEGESGKSTTEQ